MTNAMIIFLERVRLMEEGVIAGTGIKTVIKEADGTEKEYELPEEIHTYQRWKSLGYQVKRGSKCVTQIPIWKYLGKKSDNLDEEKAQAEGRCYMKTASFFTASQVEKMEVTE